VTQRPNLPQSHIHFSVYESDKYLAHIYGIEDFRLTWQFDANMDPVSQ
jgi:hypothetical protein